MRWWFFLLIPIISWSQNQQQLSFQDFMVIVSNNHPMAYQAQMQTSLGEMAILSSRGGVDPKLYSNVNQKQFDGTEYYNQLNAGLKIPTWFAVSVDAGYEQNAGTYLNPENTTPDNGLYYLGLSLPVGKGLFMDERRAALRQAEIYAEQTEAQQQLMLNDLMLEAGKSYYAWYLSFLNLKVMEDAYDVAQQRELAVKRSAALGDRPSIDTLEAGIQRQTRKVQLEQAILDNQNARALVEVYLWLEGAIPVELEENTIPNVELNVEYLLENSSIDSLVAQHPALVQSRLKVDILEVQRRMNSEMLKPELNLKYNALSNSDFESNNGWTNNYVFGLQFSMPIFLRKERGKLRMTKVKIDQGELAVDQKQQELNAKVTIAMNELETVNQMIGIQKKTVVDYSQLLAGERQLFDGGESSLFMVNSREMSYIQSQVKLNQLESKLYVSELKLQHALGVLNKSL